MMSAVPILTIASTRPAADLPPPLTPPDCNLRGLPFMPLQVVQLLDSDLFIKSTGDEFKAAVALWCKSWNQIPGGSLPDDDEILEALSGSKVWKKVKPMAMRGWFKCSDGRLYHPVVAQNALQAWEGREEHREVTDNKKSRQQRWRERVAEISKQLRDAGVTPPMNASLSKLEELMRLHVDGKASTSTSTGDVSPPSTGDKPETACKGQGKGQGDIEGVNTPSSAAKLPPCPQKAIVDLYHQILPELPEVRVLDSKPRQTALRKAWVWVLTSCTAEGDRRATNPAEALDWFKRYFERARANDFLMGKTPRSGAHANWRCDLDFLLTDRGMKHVIEKTQESQ